MFRSPGKSKHVGALIVVCSGCTPDSVATRRGLADLAEQADDPPTDA